MRKALLSKYSNRASTPRAFSFALIAPLLALLMVGCPVEEPSKGSGVVMVMVKGYGVESDVSDHPDNPDNPDMVNPELPWISKYHLRFTSGDTNVERELEPGDIDMNYTNEGYMETLEEGDWLLEVTGYTASGAAAEIGSETFTLSAAEHNVETPQKVAPFLAPADDGRGIFTCVVSWLEEEGVSAALRFEQRGVIKLAIPVHNGVITYSYELAIGSYDLFVSLSKGGVELTRYVLVNIASGCETMLKYTFTQLPVPSDRYLAGTLDGIEGHDLLDPDTPPEVKIYKDKPCTESLDTARWDADGEEWSIKITGAYTNLYFTLSGSVGGRAYTVFAGELSDIPTQGKDNIPLNFTPTFYVKEGAAPSGNGGYTTPFGTVQQAVTYIGEAVSGETIHINISGTVSGATAISDASMTGGASIILEGYDDSPGTINVGGTETGLLIDVASSARTVTLGKNLTLTGATNSGVYVQSGEFILGGGTISGNSAEYGGGVRIASGATFTMNSGTISGNSAEYGGGVHVASGATFTMNSGSIEGNSVSSGGNGGGVYITSGGIFNSAGSISNNTPNNLAIGN
jgi:hypothetical protein